MSKTTTVEQAYFHISNGGISFSIVEHLNTRKDCTVFPPDWHERQHEKGLIYSKPPAEFPTETRYNRTWRFKVTANHFGSNTEYSFPIVPLMVRWAIGALERVLARMETPQDLPTDGFEHAFRDLSYCRVGFRDGQKIADADSFWPVRPERCTSGSTDEASSTSS